MNPTGIVVIDGVQYEAASRTGLLGKGVSVRAVNIDNFRIIVEKDLEG
jgi:membrane-bound ClpP family serine protease